MNMFLDNFILGNVPIVLPPAPPVYKLAGFTLPPSVFKNMLSVTLPEPPPVRGFEKPEFAPDGKRVILFNAGTPQGLTQGGTFLPDSYNTAKDPSELGREKPSPIKDSVRWYLRAFYRMKRKNFVEAPTLTYVNKEPQKSKVEKGTHHPYFKTVKIFDPNDSSAPMSAIAKTLDKEWGAPIDIPHPIRKKLDQRYNQLYRQVLQIQW